MVHHAPVVTFILCGEDTTLQAFCCVFISRPGALQVYFEQGNHFLYIEEPEKFNQLVIDFVEKGLAAVCNISSV